MTTRGLVIEVPGWKALGLEHLVLDFNGTLARDGRLLEGVRERLDALARQLTVHVVSADTFGTVRREIGGAGCEVNVLPVGREAEAKRDYVNRLGAAVTAAVGNGRNDRMMLEAAALGIAVILEEGASAEAIAAADVVCGSVLDALDLLREPRRIVATLRA